MNIRGLGAGAAFLAQLIVASTFADSLNGFQERLQKSRDGGTDFSIAQEAIAWGSVVSSPESLQILAEAIGSGRMNDAQLKQLSASVEQKKSNLKKGDKEVAIDLVHFARLKHTDRVATCSNTLHQPVGFVANVNGSIKNYLLGNSGVIKFVDHNKDTRKDMAGLGSLVGQNADLQGADGGAARAHLLARVSPNKTQAVQSVDAAIQSLATQSDETGSGNSSANE